MSNNLRLIDTASGHEFKTYNSAVIASVLEVIRKTLDEKHPFMIISSIPSIKSVPATDTDSGILS